MRTIRGSWILVALALVACKDRGAQEQPAGGGGGDVQEVGGEPQGGGVFGGDQQQQQQQQQQQRDEAQPEQQGRADQAADHQQTAQATIRGTVQELSFGAGKMVLETGTGPMTFRARPFELRQLVPGDVVQVNYAKFGEENWVLPGQDWQSDASYGQQTTLTGNVDSVDAKKGTITVRGEKLHAHPAQIEELQPGQFVRVTYVRIEDQPWVGDIEPMQGEPRGS